MKAQVAAAADLTVGDIDSLDDSRLKEAARVIRAFLVHFGGGISGWKPWLKYAVAAVIAILDLLIGDTAEGGA